MADDYQGRGLGPFCSCTLAEAAEEQGVAVFEASVLPQNFRMAEVFRDSGFSVRMRSEPDLVAVEMPTTISPAARERFDERERSAASPRSRSSSSPRPWP